MGTAFAGQLRTGRDRPLDVTVDLDGHTVAMRAGSSVIGRWPRADCRFEPRAGGRYDFHVDGETVSLEINDANAFQRALLVVWEDRRSILPIPLLVVAAAVTAASLLAAVVGLGEPRETDAAGTPAPVATSVVPSADAVDSGRGLTDRSRGDANQVAESDRPTLTNRPVSAEGLVARWNAISPTRRFVLAGPGHNTLGAHLAVQVVDDGVEVSGTVTADPDHNREIVAALGMAVAVLDPALPPSGRRDVLETLGLDMDGDNPDPLDRAATIGDVAYALEYRPGETLRLSAHRVP